MVRRPGRKNWYLRVWDPGSKTPRYISTKTPDFAAAKVQARNLARQIEDSEERFHDDGPSLRYVFRRYLEEVTPGKGKSTQASDKRRSALWLEHLDGDSPAVRVSRDDWKAFIRKRTGRPRTVRADLSWLRSVLKWAKAEEIISTNPTADYRLPADAQPRQPLASRERYEATMEHATGMLAEILPVIVLSGRRLSSVLHLQYGDLRLDARPPTIRWRAESDKQRRETTVPLAAELHAHLSRIVHSRPGTGRAWLFPAPSDPEKPIDRWGASRWLRKAEEDAGLEPLDGSLWHAYRRMWATERKWMSPVDVAYYGGWTNILTLELIYQRPDDRSLLEVAEGNYELREKRPQKNTRKRRRSRPAI